MKKFTLFLVATLFSALSFAALNPYAYGLSSSHEGTTLKVNYSLNAPATAVSVVIMDGETEVKTIACDGITKGSHTVDVSTLDLPTGKSLTWKVDVKGTSVTTPTLHDESIRFYLPYGMDVDVDPESDYMGNWYVIEASNDGKAKTGYQCNPFGRGLYAFDATLNPILNSAGTRGFLGGVNAGYTEKNINGDYVNFYRVATSGGRVFIGRYRDGASYHPIVEANPADLNANFTTVFETGRAVSIDAKGSGENLKLVMLAKDNNIYEYDLGNAKSIAAASRTINKGTLSIARDDATITYDNNGDIWFNQHQESPTANTPTIAHLSIENGFDWNNVSASISHANTSNSGIAVSPDGKQLAVVGAGQKNITIYNINNAGGNITLTKAYTIATAGNNHTALAWDYAGNLFAANRTNERIRIFAMPYSGTVSTPCASKYAFVIPPQLNPFAYKLSSELSADEKNLTIKYSLNANATSVNWVLLDGNNVVNTVDLSSLGLEKGDYTTTISTTDFPQYKALTWKIEVKGVAVDEVTAVKGESFYRPFGVDIDNNPENKHFGRILCGETSTHGKSGYVSSDLGAGIYAYDAGFEALPNGTKPGYNGGKTFTDHSPYRIRISDDGRIFVTAHDKAGDFLWEVNPENLNEWTSVFKGATHNADKLLDAASKFIAGTNAGFDVRGKGENLQLLMLSCNNLGTSSATFQCHEYNLGNATEWSAVPTRSISGIQLHSSMIARYSQVTYDNEGGFWCTYYINTTILGGIAHFTKEGIKDYEKHGIMLRAGACVFNHDFSKLILCGDVDVTTNSPGSAVIYSVSKDADGKPVLTKETTINTAVVGGNLNDFAWDYANNIYVVGNNGELLQVYALPHSSDDVVATPAASKYTFSIGKYTMIANTNDENKGTVTGAGEYKVGETATLTATAKEGYKLLYWSDRSTTNPRTITMNKNEAISAYFVKVYDQEPTFTVTKVWENTNVPAATGDGYQAVGWDQKIYMQNKTAGKIQVFSNGTDATVDYATSGTGQQIAVDEAGNLIVFNAYFATSTPNSVCIYKKGDATSTAVSFTLQDPARCDFFSASGDIYSPEGGYVYFYCAGKTVINRLKITNGAATTSDVTTDVVGQSVYSSPQNTNYVMVDIFGNLVAHARSNAINAINVYTNESKAFTLPSIKMGTLGGCSFELGGKELWAYHAGASNYSSEWNIYNMTDSKFLSDDDFYAVDKEATTNNACNWLNVQVVDEYTAYIYQFCPKKAVALWKVTMQAGKATYTVTANATNGSVTGAGTYEEGETATLTATPAEHYRFVNWTKGEEVVSTETTYSFVVTEDVTLTANFVAIPQYAITVETSNADQGSVTGGGTYYEGSTATLTATPVGGYVFEKWSDDNTDNPRTITVSEAATYTAIFKLAPARVFAYNLDVVDNGNDTYTLSFIPNTNAVSGRVILYNGDTKAQIHEESIAGAIVKGVKSEVVISRSLLPATGNVTWAVELTGEQVEKLTLLTKANDKANYGFNRPQGVAIDNNPASDFFGRIYIALPKAGGTGYSDTNYGIVVMDPQHKRLKSGVVANGDALGADGRYSMHRVAVNPTNGHVYYVRTSDSNEGVTGTAIYELTPDATNILTDGGTAKNVISDASDITNANSVCFDETGAMYVMANANYDSGASLGRVYKVVDGVATLFTPNSIELASRDNAIVPDGKGGFWAAQHRDNFDTFSHLLHITATGTVDYSIDKNSADASLLPVQPYTSGGKDYTNASYRGQVAYYSIDENNGLVAYGGGAKVSVFKVSYDGAGKPSLTAWQTISLLTQSTKAGVNVDGIAFDYAGNIIVMSATDERMYQYALPIESANTSLVPSPTSKAIKLGTIYTVEVAVNDPAMGTATGGGEYLEGEIVTVTATANTGYRFVNWTYGSETSTNNPLELVVEGNITVTANFEPVQYTLIAPTNDEDKGTVSGAGAYNYGTEVTLTATPKEGYKLLYWSDRSTENPRTITMTKNEVISAYFVKEYAEEPTFKIEKMWENTMVPTSSNNGFQAVGWDEKIYMKDRGNKQILVFSDATTSAMYVATDDKDDQPIAIDDAGNIIIRSGSGFFYNAPTQVTIYKNGDKTGKVIDFTLPATGRCDFISASGDIYSAEGGYVYFYCQNQTTVSRLYIKNGGAGAADISVDEVGATLTAGSSQSHVFTNIFGNLMTHTRASVKVLQEVNVATGAVTTMNLPNFKQSTLGGCSFELGGKEFIAYNIAGTDYNSEWNLYNMTDKEFVSAETLYAKDRTSKKTSGAANWLNVQVVDEKTAYIYQFCPEVAVAVWKVTCTTEKTVIIDENVDNTTNLAPYVGKKVTATVTRNFGANKILTLTLPFDMSATQISTYFGNATVYEFYNVVNAGAELHLQLSRTNAIEAGKPYILKTTSGYDAEDGFTIEDVIINTERTSVKIGELTMVPVLNGGGILDQSTQYYLYDNALYCAGDYNQPLPGLRAYFTSASPTPLRARVIFEDNEATSIPVVSAPENKAQKIIKDGRLIIIRGEHQYNAQGQVIE